jgi:ATP-dependent phosphofructokinase / diphosphate-dependent phosphofructokinase
MAKQIGILTSGGDCPGLNAAIRAVGKAAEAHGIRVIGFCDGFRGLVQDRTMTLEGAGLSGLLVQGGTILGTSRDKPHKMPIGGKMRNMTDAIVDTYHRHSLDALICIGGGGTQKNALRLHKAGLNIITLPKTIDNDVACTEVTIGFQTSLRIATDAIDLLHSTATSHHRLIVVEIMGHRAGWLALAAGIAGGADLILIPEIPYSLEKAASAVRERTRAGKRFSIVAVAEGAMSVEDAATVTALVKKRDNAKNDADAEKASAQLQAFHDHHVDHTVRLTEQLEKLAGIESRLTILGHLQRGGAPVAADRILATQLGTECINLVMQKKFGVMIAVQDHKLVPVPLKQVAGNKKFVPLDHPWIQSARAMGTSFGD